MALSSREGLAVGVEPAGPRSGESRGVDPQGPARHAENYQVKCKPSC